MRVKMNTSMPVTVDGVHTLDLEAGETYDVGDGVGENLIDTGAAETADTHEATPSRGRARGKKAEAADTHEEPETE